MRNNQLISHYGKWLDAQNISYDSDNGYTPEQEKEYYLVSEILAIEHAIYVLRRTNKPYIDGSLIDALWSLKTKAINHYEEVMGKEYYDANINVDF